MFGAERKNSAGVDLTDTDALKALQAEVDAAAARDWSAARPIGGVAERQFRGRRGPFVPADRRVKVGMATATARRSTPRWRAPIALPAWSATPAGERAARSLTASPIFRESSRGAVIACIREAGKTIPDAIAEFREAVDFAATTPRGPAPTSPGRWRCLDRPANGTSCHCMAAGLCLHQPVEFSAGDLPVRVTAALAAGNTVIAKPAEQTPSSRALAVKLLHQAGVPVDALHLLPATGRWWGAAG